MVFLHTHVPQNPTLAMGIFLAPLPQLHVNVLLHRFGIV